jgi:O-antigen ligase
MLPLLAILAPLALAPLIVGAALIAAFRHDGRRAWATVRAAGFPLPALVLSLLFLWAGLSSIWSPDPFYAVQTIARSVGCAAAGWLLVTLVRTDRLPAATPRALAVGLLWASVLLLTAEMAEHTLLVQKSVFAAWAAKGVTHMDRGTTVCVLLLWPVVVDFWQNGQRRSAGFLLLVVAAACALSHDAAAKVGLLLGGGVIVLAFRAPRVAAWMLGAGMALAILLAPVAARQIPPPEISLHWHWLMRTAHHRLTIWRFAAERIADAPVFGAGLEASRQIGQGRHVILTDDFGDVRDEEVMPLHPHDAALQIWLELGGVGAVLAAGFTSLLGVWLARSRGSPVSPSLQASGAAMLASAFFFASVSYGLWQSWWHAALWLSYAVWSGLPPRPVED